MRGLKGELKRRKPGLKERSRNFQLEMEEPCPVETCSTHEFGDQGFNGILKPSLAQLVYKCRISFARGGFSILNTIPAGGSDRRVSARSGAAAHPESDVKKGKD